MNNAHLYVFFFLFYFSIILLLFRYLSQNCHVCWRFLQFLPFNIIMLAIILSWFLCRAIASAITEQSFLFSPPFALHTSHIVTLFVFSSQKWNEIYFEITVCAYKMYYNASFTLQPNALPFESLVKCLHYILIPCFFSLLVDDSGVRRGKKWLQLSSLVAAIKRFVVQFWWAFLSLLNFSLWWWKNMLGTLLRTLFLDAKLFSPLFSSHTIHFQAMLFHP